MATPYHLPKKRGALKNTPKNLFFLEALLSRSLTTTHKSNVQWMSISFVWLYMFKCDVCVLNHMWIKSKRFLFFLLAFGSDLYLPCFKKKKKKVDFVWKTCFLGVFVTYFMSQLNREFKWSNSQVFQLWIESFMRRAY